MTSAGLRILLASAVLCTPINASGQAPELRGKVVNESGEGIAGVTVTLTRIGYSVRTDSAGEFALSGHRRAYINRGVGHLVAVRFNVRPEVTLFELTSE